MKKLLLILSLVLICSTIFAQQANSSGSIDSSQLAASIDSTATNECTDEDSSYTHHSDFNDSAIDRSSLLKSMGENVLIPIVAIVFIFGSPVFIVLIIFITRYQTKKAQYRIAEKALMAGKEIPQEFFETKVDKENLQTKGIKNVFLGLGLGIFLWALIGFDFGCIGFIIMFMGIGQILIHHTQTAKNTVKENQNSIYLPYEEDKKSTEE